jgi:hypothetical protein
MSRKPTKAALQADIEKLRALLVKQTKRIQALEGGVNVSVTIELLRGADKEWHWQARNHKTNRITGRGRREGYFQVQNARRSAQRFVSSLGADPKSVEFRVLKNVLSVAVN